LSEITKDTNVLYNFFIDLKHDFLEEHDDLLRDSMLSFSKSEWMKKHKDIFSYKILIAGRTGVGKSSFINYLFGDDICETGAGRPVTEKNIFSKEFFLNGIKLNLYDSSGIEVGRINEWKTMINEEIKKCTNNIDIRNRIHTVFYCISAGSARVEDFELDVLKDMIKKNYPVSIILTKADQATINEIEDITNVIRSTFGNDLNLIPVCSTEKKLFDGNVIKPFGEKEVECLIVEGLKDLIIKKCK
jgi:septin family protein